MTRVPNQNIDYASNLLSTGPVDWVTPLAQYYKDDETQRNKQGQLLERQDAQRAAAVKTGSVVDLFSKLAKFSTAARKLKHNLDKVNAQREVEDNKEVQGFIDLLGPEYGNDYIEASKLLHKKTVQGIAIDEERLTELQEKLRKQEDDDPLASQARLGIMNAKGSTLVFVKSMYARQQLQGTNPNSMLKAFAADDRFAELNAEYNAAVDAKDDNAKQAVFRKFQRKQLAHLDLNATTFAAVLGTEVRRQQQTSRGINRANTVTAIANEQDHKVRTFLESARGTGTFSDSVHQLYDHFAQNGEFTEEKDSAGKVIGPTKDAQIKERIFGHLKRLAYDGQISTGDLESYLTSIVKTPATGKEGAEVQKIILSKDQVNDLISSAKIGNTRYLEVERSIVDKSLPDLELRKRRGEDVSVEIARIRRLYPDEGMGKKLDNIENIVVDNDSEEGSYAFENAKLQNTRQDGKIHLLTEADINAIPNSRVREEIRAEWKLIKKAPGASDYGEKWIDVLAASGMDQTLKEEDVLSRKGVKVRNDLRLFFRRTYETLVKNDPKNPNNLNLAMKATDDYFKAHGGGTKTTVVGAGGKFAAHPDGYYPNYDTYVQKKDQRYKHSIVGSSSDEQLLEYSDRVHTAIKEVNFNIPGKTVVDKVLNTPHSILDAEDIMGAYETGTISQEIKLKAKQLGVDVFTLLQAQYNASKGDPAYTNFDTSALKTLDEKSEQMVAIQQTLRNSGQNDLVYILKRVQLQNASPNQLLRFRKALTDAEVGRAEGFQSTIEETAASAEEIAAARLLEINRKKAKKIKERLDRTMQGIQETEDERRSPGFGSDVNPASNADYETDYI